MITERTPFQPEDDYALSKVEAERALEKERGPGYSITIVRPPMVYGAGFKHPLGPLMRLAGKGMPLPLGSLNEGRRSMIGVANLCEFLTLCSTRPDDSDDDFLVCDNEALTTRELLEACAAATGRSSRVFPFPKQIIAWAARVLGAYGSYEKLNCAYQLDCRKAQARLEWRPTHCLQDGLAAALGLAQDPTPATPPKVPFQL